jgi:hypothetical protein
VRELKSAKGPHEPSPLGQCYFYQLNRTKGVQFIPALQALWRNCRKPRPLANAIRLRAPSARSVDGLVDVFVFIAV